MQSQFGTHRPPNQLPERMSSRPQTPTSPQGIGLAWPDSHPHRKPSNNQLTSDYFIPCDDVLIPQTEHRFPLTSWCFHEVTSSLMLSTGLRMTCCRNSLQSTVIELSLSILTNTTKKTVSDVHSTDVKTPSLQYSTDHIDHLFPQH